MTLHPWRGRARAGFTLIELLVVMGIIAFLAALLVMFFPSVSSQTAESNGAVSLQGWLNIARQKAIRNQNPFGVRLWVQNTANMQVVECSYIEQPEDFSGGTLSTSGNQANLVTINGVDVTGGFGDPTLYPVQSGDYLEVVGTGLMHSIAYPTQANPTPIASNGTASQLTLNTAIPYQIASATPNYRIVRAPRVIGEEMLPLPTGVVVDLQTNATYGNPINPSYNATGTGAYVDVLFGPSGSVLLPRVSQTTLNFWVRLPDTNNPTNVFAGSPSIIAVFTQTGLVGAYTPGPNNPYVDIY